MAKADQVPLPSAAMMVLNRQKMRGPDHHRTMMWVTSPPKEINRVRGGTSGRAFSGGDIFVEDLDG